MSTSSFLSNYLVDHADPVEIFNLDNFVNTENLGGFVQVELVDFVVVDLFDLNELVEFIYFVNLTEHVELIDLIEHVDIVDLAGLVDPRRYYYVS